MIRVPDLRLPGFSESNTIYMLSFSLAPASRNPQGGSHIIRTWVIVGNFEKNPQEEYSPRSSFVRVGSLRSLELGGSGFRLVEIKLVSPLSLTQAPRGFGLCSYRAQLALKPPSYAGCH